MIVHATPEPAWVAMTGYLAAFCTTVAFVPQLLRVIELRSAREISLGMFLIFSLGVALWLIFGLKTRSGPVIASNAATLVLSLAILWLKLKFDRSARQQKEPKP